MHYGSLSQPRFELVLRSFNDSLSSDDLRAEFDGFCKSLGFFEAIDKDKTASMVFRRVLEVSGINNKGISSSALARRIGMSRGSILNHLGNLKQSGLIVKHGTLYSTRSNSLLRTVEEVESDVDRVFERLKRQARLIDEHLEEF